MKTRILVGCLLAIFLSAGRGWAQDDPHHLDPKDIPDAWKKFSGDPYLYLPVPPDPPEAARDAKLISTPHQKAEVMEVRVGDKLRLGPEAIRDGWRIDRVVTFTGVLWPVDGAPRVFLARCPGETSIDFYQGPKDAPSQPPPPPRSRPVFVDALPPLRVHVIPSAVQRSGCDLPIDPPTSIRAAGSLTFRNLHQRVIMTVGEEVTLIGEGPCASTWPTEYHLGNSAILAPIGKDVHSVRFRAEQKGVTILSVPQARHGHCTLQDDPHNAFLIEVQ